MTLQFRSTSAFLLLSMLLSLATTSPIAAQESAEETAPDATATDRPAAETAPLRAAREESLINVLAARRQLEADLRVLQTLLGSDAARGREDELEGEIRMISRELADLTRSFSELASGVDPRSIESHQESEDLELTREVKDLLGPLVNELKRATSRPREIDRLRTEISEHEERLDKITNALARLAKLESAERDPVLGEALEAERRDWTRRKSAINTQLDVAEQKLEQLRGESQSIAEAIENLFQLFFKSRGRNLLLALLATVGFLFAIRRLRTFLSGREALARRSESFQGRVFSLIYSAFSVIGAILVFLIALYFFGDWVLLILMLLLILGIIWTSKQAIPRFWSQAVLILDMGPVREGERVNYDGLHWHVDSISFYSVLKNPVLLGGLIRVPIDDLSSLRSRAYHEDEPWFPTKQGDVILMPDGRPAEVEFQAVDGVRLRMAGDNRTLIPATEFAQQTIEKLNYGYRVDIQFGLDYADQAEITTTMRERLERGIIEKWRDSPWHESFLSAGVQFKEAAASSLDYYVFVDLDGSAAFDIMGQQRQLARFCVDVCNEEGWSIPFSQLTVHVAPPEN